MCAWAVQIFRNGNAEIPAEYGGPRDAPGIVSYVEKASGPPSKELTTAAEVGAPTITLILALHSIITSFVHWMKSL